MITAEKGIKIALVACAGSGLRAGLPYNKLLYRVNGKTIAEYTLDNFYEAKKLNIVSDIIILCSGADRHEFEKIAARYGADIVTGGKTRAQSVKNGLSYIKEKYASYPANDIIVLVCDGARPNGSADIIKRCAESAAVYGSGIAAVPVPDTVKFAGNGVVSSTPDRTNLYLAQTPQAFDFNGLYEAYTKAGADADGLTDDSAVMERFGKIKVRLVNGGYDNYKITAAEDIKRFESEKTAGKGKTTAMDICEGVNIRIGAGSDTHRLVNNGELILGGVTIPHSSGLYGHSDADALVHSIIDALLSAASLRDIGFHFPDTDPGLKGADSIELLKKTAGLLKDKQASIINISSVIHAERPKLNPYIPQMAENIARALNTEKERISISAKTGEGIGVIGEEKAVSCETVCLISLGADK